MYTNDLNADKKFVIFITFIEGDVMDIVDNNDNDVAKAVINISVVQYKSGSGKKSMNLD